MLGQLKYVCVAAVDVAARPACRSVGEVRSRETRLSGIDVLSGQTRLTCPAMIDDHQKTY